MVDFVSLVLGFPATVEGIVKTCRVVHDYRQLQDDHRLAINRAIFGTKKLAYYVAFINVKAVHTDPQSLEARRQHLLIEAFLHASDAMLTMAYVVESWTVRLRMDTAKSGREYMARLAAAVAEKLARSQKSSNVTGFDRSRMGKLVSEVAYLAMGCRQINDSMDALERWTGNLRDILLSFQDLRSVRDPFPGSEDEMKDIADELLLISRLKTRAEQNETVNHIVASEIDTYKDLDEIHPTGFYSIEKGRYMGCIIDRRDMNYLIAQEKGEQAVSETDNIARLFAEERSGTANVYTASFGILRCCGWAQVSTRFLSTEHDLVLRPPSGTSSPRTLRMLLLDGPPQHPLESRLQFCIQLATSVLIVHSLNLVHKDIRPDSILVFESLKPLNAKEDDFFPKKLGSPYLARFDRARSEDVDTVINPFAYSPYMRDLYTHPVHTTSAEHIRYSMRDDIYSLGVVLIEVALWKSLFSWSEQKKCYDADFSWFDFSVEKYKQIFTDRGQPEYRNRGWLVRWDLIELAEREIPVIMGTTFKDVVVSCLTFGEPSKPTLDESVKKIMEAGYQPQGESVLFVQNILSKLRRLNLSCRDLSPQA
ncbi:uncharacterized protein FOMMEDRAFT_160243 [Fomitiporia mediterranea MF3/22]|uniref:uncharacterized protein n=1 Tax=Fomitiporia mediterranea (strain MF3/22) TaxID=694068 RepID=UPI0004407B7E|nr:uncharacterized protein FOMMEDRAFT_160243 [Fomitiporia mediterranea MF3/22]EJC99801.1 hypothetical protein FOMMEDRAFT_160243 [Fomitiporia mediterranea MF3/22]